MDGFDPHPRARKGVEAEANERGREHPKVRNEHGTRVTRAIKCSRCGAEDRVHFIPRHQERVLCRSCAAETLEVADFDAGIFPPEPQSAPEPPRPASERRNTGGGGVIRVRRRNEDDEQ